MPAPKSSILFTGCELNWLSLEHLTFLIFATFKRNQNACFPTLLKNVLKTPYNLSMAQTHHQMHQLL